MLGKLGGPIGAALGSLIGPVIGMLAKIGGPSKAEQAARTSQSSMIDNLKKIATQGEIMEGALTDNYHTVAIVARDAFTKSGLSAAEAEKKVKALLDTHNPQAFTRAMDELNTVLADNLLKQERLDKLTNDVPEAINAVQEAMDKWKLTITDMGPAFQQQDLEGKALGLYQQFILLKGAGADVTTVLDHMKSGFQDVVSASLTMGTAIPEQLRDPIQRLIDMGELTDDTGAKLTDISKFSLAETLDKKFDTLITKIGDLVDALAYDLTGAINGLPDKTVHVNVVTSGMPDTPDYGGQQPDYSAGGGAVYAAQGRVIPFAPARGSDTVRAMLTPGEQVLSVSEAEAYRKNKAGDKIVPLVINMEGRKVIEALLRVPA